MPYKIVQIIERGKSVLVAVPQQWEQDGILYWPRKNSEKLQKNQNSEPDVNWSAKNCILKRINIITLQKAESIINEMCENSDTEAEPDVSQRTRMSKSKNNTQTDFNAMAEECSKSYNKKIINPDGETELPILLENFDKKESFVITQRALPEAITTSQPPLYENFDDQESIVITQGALPQAVTVPVSEEPQTPIILQQLEESSLTNYVLPKIDEISEGLKTATTTLNTINENQEILFQTQNKILSKLSEMQTQFEEIVKQLFKPTNKTHSTDIKPISNLKEFQEFEDLLSTNDPGIVTELKNKLLVACSKGKGRGYNNAYILIDILFDRNFLKDCSWAGGSKSDKIKICFKGFTKTIHLFFNVIHESDGDFTLVDCHKFLKTILRNSLQRCNNKQLRLSSKKIRQKKTMNTSQFQPIVSAENQQDKPQPEPMVVRLQPVPMVVSPQPEPMVVLPQTEPMVVPPQRESMVVPGCSTNNDV